MKFKLKNLSSGESANSEEMQENVSFALLRLCVLLNGAPWQPGKQDELHWGKHLQEERGQTQGRHSLLGTPSTPAPGAGSFLSIATNVLGSESDHCVHFPPLSGGQMLHTHTHICSHPVTRVPHVRAHTHLRSTHWSFPGVFHFLICWDWIRRCSLVLLGVICSALSSVQPHLQTPLLPCEMRAPIRLREYSGSSCHQVSHSKKKKKKNCLHSCIRNLFFPLRKRPSLKCKMGRRRVQAVTSNQEKIKSASDPRRRENGKPQGRKEALPGPDLMEELEARILRRQNRGVLDWKLFNETKKKLVS